MSANESANGGATENAFGTAAADSTSPGGSGSVAPSPPPSSCRVVSAESACLSADAWKEAARKKCAAVGAPIADLRVEGACSDGGFGRAAAVCCSLPPTLPPQPPTNPPPGPTPPPSCSGFATGYTPGDRCRSAAEWKAYAAETCRADGKNLVDYQPTTPCADPETFQGVTARCCSAEPPTPSGCVDGSMSGLERTFRPAATAACAALRREVSRFDEFATSGRTYAKFSCCSARPTPEPVPVQPPAPTPIH